MPTPSLPSRLHRMRWKLVAGATAIALSLGAAAALPTNLATASPPRTPTKANATHTITLITGDRVTVSTHADGKQIAEIKRPESATGGVRVLEVGGDMVVLPDEVLPLLTANKLDRRLFNVTDLIEMGYDDAKSAELPLIASFEPTKARAAKPSAPKGSRLIRDLAAIGGASLRTEKKQAREFWRSVAPAPATPTTLGSGVKKIWLDGRVKASLAESVPMIGAPQAWALGLNGAGVKVAVLDTGIDATHPDLVTQIDDKVSFVPDEDTADINGHGTHVASTIVGTGAASGGANKGVAPGADLIVGKVLGGVEGYGADSWVLAGMQWAAESGADIVSMSLGDSFPSDGSDPMSMAVDNLTAQYGSLFVIAAGNAGPESISAPGAAASALTVGAVDKQDNLAYFSSTGPLTVTGAMKPDISAPGVDINAAWSAQSASYDGPYKSISGTSMATPHVSGAAAILVQQHPTWTAQQLKDQLMTSSKALADWYSPYEVGTGRADVVAAISNKVQTGGSLFFGNFDWPHEPSDGPVTKPLVFSNNGSAAVTLNLAVTGTGPFTLGSTSVTVPAGGTGSVLVTGDPTGAVYGRLTGYLVATDAATGNVATRTSLGIIKEEERYNFKIKLLDRDGLPANAYVVLKKSDDFWPYILFVQGEQTLRLPPGTYVTDTVIDVKGERPDSLGVASMLDPETVLNKNTELVLDARKARFLDTVAPQRSEKRQSKVDFQITFNDGNEYRSGFVPPPAYDDTYVLPTEKMTQGKLEAVTRWRMGEEMLSLSVLGLLPFPATVQPFSTLTAGTETLKSVYAGFGAAGDYAKLNAKGKAVVVTRSDAVSPEERTAAAVAAGAKLLVVVNDGVGVLNEYVGEPPIPVVTVHRDAGALLVKLAKTGLVPLRVKQVPYTSFVYDLVRHYPGNVPNRALTYKPKQSDLARINANYHGTKDQEGGGYRYDMVFSPSLGYFEREFYPGTRVEWVTPDVVWHEGHGIPSNEWTDNSYHNTFAKGTTSTLNWFAPAIRPAFTRAFAVQNGRYRDAMTINVQAWSSSGSDGLEHGGNLLWGAYPTNMKLYQGDTLINENVWSSAIQWVEVPAGRLPFHVVLDASRPAEEFVLSTRTHTEWDFISESNESDNFEPMALMQLDYSLATDLRGNVKAGSVQQFSVSPIAALGTSGIGNVTSVSLEVSYDDGATWQPVTLTKANGKWSANLKLNGPAGGYMSLRAAASTDAGFGIKQEVIRAYGLK